MEKQDIPTVALQIINGNRRALARAISLAESTRDEDRASVGEVFKQLKSLFPTLPFAHRLGITGSPGVGKSTFVETLGELLCNQGKKVAVLTVDPSSRITGGSILGDKVRMPTLSNNPNCFVRSSPAGGTLGGLTASTADVITLCEYAGFDTVIVESVGVGQSETDLALLVDCFILLILPDSGDEVQGIKRGVMEFADILLLTKCDGDRIVDSQTQCAALQSTVRMHLPRSEDWSAQVHTISSREKTGFDNVDESLTKFFHFERIDRLKSQRAKNLPTVFKTSLANEILRRVLERNDFYSTEKQSLVSIESAAVPVSLAVQEMLRELQ